MAANRPVAYTAEEIDDFLARKKAAKENKPIPQRTEGEFNIVMEPEGLYRVEHAAGAGRIPVILQGRFTSVSKVLALIEHYKATK